MATNSWAAGGGVFNFGTEGDPNLDWSLGATPTSTEDAVVNTGASGAILSAGSPEDVNSISLGGADALVIQDGSDFTAAGGTGSNVNNGTIRINGAALYLGNGTNTATFDNSSTGTIKLTGTSANTLAALNFDGSVNLTGSGVIAMTIGGNPSDNLIRGTPLFGIPALVNESETISGTGTIGSNLVFINGTNGTIETNNTTSSSGGILHIEGSAAGGSFTNNSTVEAGNGGTLVFGVDGEASTIVNNASGAGGIELDGAFTKLEIAGSVTISSSSEGRIVLGGTGVGDLILGDGGAATTLTLINQTLKGAGTVGDNLVLNNESGTIDADLDNEPLALGDSQHSIVNGATGTLMAENGGFLDIDDPLSNSGTVIAENHGTVNVEAPTSGAGAIDIGANGFLDVAATISGNVNFTGANVSLIIDNSDSSGGIGGSIVGGQFNDTIAFSKIEYSTSQQVVWNQTSSTGGILSLVSGGSTLDSLNLAGQYTNGDFGVGAGTNGEAVIGLANPNPPAATTAVMIMIDGSGGDWEIYDIGNNAILAAYTLSVGVASGFQTVGVGGFNGTDTYDVMLRNASTGVLEIVDCSNNNSAQPITVGQVGLEWAVAGFGDFSTNPGETDMLMRDSNTGAFEIYDISNNAITNYAAMGQVGLEWSVAGFGDFSTQPNETDMLMRNNNTGAFELFDIRNNQITSAASMGQVGLEWSVAGFGDFSGNANETDMLMRNNNTGVFEVFDISNNQITSAAPMGQVGGEWRVVGFGPFNGASNSDMLMRNTNTGVFEVFDITNNQITAAAAMGQVGDEWQVAGVAADPPSGPAAASDHLVQAMASLSSDNALYTNASAGQPSPQPAPTDIFGAATGQNQPIG